MTHNTGAGDVPTRDDSTTTCPICWTHFRPVGRQRFCSGNCRKTAWSRTRQTPRPAAPVPPPGQLRAASIYLCPSCENRYLGLQWCPDCNQPCTRVGLGGPCPHCDEPVAINDLFDTPPQTPPTAQKS